MEQVARSARRSTRSRTPTAGKGNGNGGKGSKGERTSERASGLEILIFRLSDEAMVKGQFVKIEDALA